MNCIIIEDEPLAIQGLKILLTDIEDINILAEFEEAHKAIHFLQNNRVDLIFLDIEMPKISGLDFIKILEKKPLIIIITAYPQYAVESFELDVTDYLLKPIRFDRLLKAVNKAKKILQNENAEKNTNDHIYVRTNRKFVKIYLDNITYIEGLKDYITINTTDNKYVTRMSMKNICEKLNEPSFFRINKSYIINTNFITEVEADIVKITEKELSIGTSYKVRFYEEIVNKKLLKR